MSRRFNTKSDQILQILPLTDPVVFDGGAAPLVAQNMTHTYEPSDEFDSFQRDVATGKAFNAVVSRMHEGQIDGPLYYNLIDEQFLRYIFDSVTETTAAGVVTRTRTLAQTGYRGGDFFAVEEGTNDKARRGLYGFYTSFSINSKRGKSGNTRTSAKFVTQSPSEINGISGGVARPTKFTAVLTDVDGDRVLTFKDADGTTAGTVTIATTDTASDVQTKIRALGAPYANATVTLV